MLNLVCSTKRKVLALREISERGVTDQSECDHQQERNGDRKMCDAVPDGLTGSFDRVVQQEHVVMAHET